MLADGIYRIEYSGTCAGEDEGDCALAVLRDGRIMGSDKHNGAFMGTHRHDPKTGRERLSIWIDIPAGGIMVNGIRGGVDGRSIELKFELAAGDAAIPAKIEIEGQPLNIALTYVGPLPD